jgi:hypothetical protein
LEDSEVSLVIAEDAAAVLAGNGLILWVVSVGTLVEDVDLGGQLTPLGGLLVRGVFVIDLGDFHHIVLSELLSHLGLILVESEVVVLGLTLALLLSRGVTLRMEGTRVFAVILVGQVLLGFLQIPLFQFGDA